jgi:uncharacterized protein YqiB (DUF1249 family)
MRATKEIFSTIVKVTYTNYSENIAVNEKNANQLRNLINTDKDVQKYEIYFQGDYIFNLVEQNERTTEVECVSYYRDGSTKRTTTETVIIRKDNKIKFDGDCMGSYSFRFQKVKSTSFGDYINVYGERMYFAWDAPTFKNQ